MNNDNFRELIDSLPDLTAVQKRSSYYGFYAYQLKRLEDLSIETKEKLIKLPKMPPGSPI